ncbi:hypothetical protein [uncultured Croceitalea sp.]|uniref:hypothetical protein n=1 Tax=uncultured Croceitalea sp. TaxID=1798908 RepID=UPI003305D659
MYITKSGLPTTSILDITKDYNYYKQKRLKFRAKVKRVSLNSSIIIVEGYTNDSFIRIPKKLKSVLEELWETNNWIDVQIGVEGVPYFCRYRGIVGIKKGEILSVVPI